ncbi:MAG: hypothetical protein SCALA702_00250 [Melioribacteraceae bacterium]|nr:MAG: hypothetical protein SCALA702_00250 [Melioribacteraceae bacterium]
MLTIEKIKKKFEYIKSDEMEFYGGEWEHELQKTRAELFFNAENKVLFPEQIDSLNWMNEHYSMLAKEAGDYIDIEIRKSGKVNAHKVYNATIEFDIITVSLPNKEYDIEINCSKSIGNFFRKEIFYTVMLIKDKKILSIEKNWID